MTTHQPQGPSSAVPGTPRRRTIDREHELQFKVQQVTTTQPTTVEGIEKYLGSGMIRGIGAVYARALARAFGEQVFDLIELLTVVRDRAPARFGLHPVRDMQVLCPMNRGSLGTSWCWPMPRRSTRRRGPSILPW